MSKTLSDAASRPPIAPILVVNFVGALGYSIVLPFLVFLVVRLGGNAVVYGVIGATYSAFQLVGAPVLGRWSDRVGRRKVLLASQVGTLASWGIFLAAFALPVRPLVSVDSSVLGSFTLTLPLVVLFLARALDGVTGGNVSVANAYLADITTEEERSANFGRMAVSSNLGFVLGPALAGLLGAAGSGEELPVLGAFVISALATLVILFALRDPEPCVLSERAEPTSVRGVLGGDQKECYEIEGKGRLSLTRVVGLPRVGLLLALQFLVFLAFNFYYVAFPVHASTALDWTIADVGVFFAVMGLLMALVQGPLLGRLSKRVAEGPLVVGGSLVLAGSFVLFASRSSAVLYTGAALLALGNGVMWPSLLSVLSKAVGREHQGAVQGVSGSATAIASIAGLLLGGGLYELLDARVFFLSAAVTALVAILALWIDRPAPGAETDELTRNRASSEGGTENDRAPGIPS